MTLREWYIVHGQNSGAFRNGQFGNTTTNSTGSREPDAPAPLKREMFKRDGYRCRYCGVRLFPKRRLGCISTGCRHRLIPDEKRKQRSSYGAAVVFVATHDHVVPCNRGGLNSLANLVTSCWSCQFGKYNWTLEQLGLEDPRIRPPRTSDGWDGLVSLIPKLRATQFG